MEFKLDVYDADGNKKTYVTDDFRLTMGTCEDILELVEVDKLMGTVAGGKVDEEQAVNIMMPMMMRLSKEYENFMKQVFPDLTHDEYRSADPGEVSGIVWNIVMYTIQQLFNISAKN